MNIHKTPAPVKPTKKHEEADLRKALSAFALTQGWLVHINYDSRRSRPGFPDITFAKPGRLVLAELKSETGRLSDVQVIWGEVLKQIPAPVEYYLWRPRDLEAAKRILSKGGLNAKKIHP